MYRGVVTTRLMEAAQKYFDRFGCGPDEYIDICFDDMPHDTLLYLTNKALELDKEIPELPEIIWRIVNTRY